MSEWDREDNGAPYDETPPLDLFTEPFSTLNIVQPRIYRCPVHGEHTGTMSITAGGDDTEAIYCMLCVKDLLDQHIGRIEEIQNDN